MFLQSSCQGVIAQKWVNLTLKKTINPGLVLTLLWPLEIGVVSPHYNGPHEQQKQEHVN